MNISKNKRTVLGLAIVLGLLISGLIFKYKTSDVVDIVDVTTNIQSSIETAPSDEQTEPLVKTSEEAKVKLAGVAAIPRNVLDLAVTAYAKAEKKDLVDNHKLTIIDYSQPSNKKRMWVIDMDKKKVDINTYVSHGARSGGKIATDFSNKLESHKSSIGVMKTGATYIGKKGKSLYLHGLEKNVNDNVYKRHVVIHGATYVSDRVASRVGQIGKSFGCPAVDNKIVKKLIGEISGGSIVFAYYPNKTWINSSKFL